jgi:hypothetical protein
MNTSNNNNDNSNNNPFTTTSRSLNFGTDDVVVKSRGLDPGSGHDTELTDDTTPPPQLLGDAWGESTVVQAYQKGECRSLGQPGQKPCQVTFTNTSPDQTLILCWIAPNGDLHHYYRLAPQGGSHLESTQTGDAFVLFAAPPLNNNHEEKRDEEEAERPNCTEQTIVAAYRPQDASRCDHHRVNLGPVETTVSSQGGFLRGTTKKQKISQWTIAVEPYRIVPPPEVPPPDEGPPPEDTTNKFYEKRQYGDWTVYCEPGCWDSTEVATTKGAHKDGARSPHEVFQADLKGLSERLPPHVRTLLAQSTVLYMNTTHSVAQTIDNPVGCFHPGRDWLIQHKMNPDKCGHVEFYNVSNYYDHRRLWGTGEYSQ